MADQHQAQNVPVRLYRTDNHSKIMSESTKTIAPSAIGENETAKPAPSVKRQILTASVWIGVLGLLLLLAWGVAFGTRGRVRSGVVVNSFAANVRVLQRPANDFTVKLFQSGETFRLSDYRGQVVVMNFWASWCVPCREEAPVLEQTWRAYKDRGVVFLGVDIWDSDADALKFLNEFRITYANGPDPSGKIAVDYGVTGIPETFFITKDGMIASKAIGVLNETTLPAILDELLKR